MGFKNRHEPPTLSTEQVQRIRKVDPHLLDDLVVGYIPRLMLGHLSTSRTVSHFPLELTRGAAPRCPERVPRMAAFAGPAHAVWRLEAARRGSDSPNR